MSVGGDAVEGAGELAVSPEKPVREPVRRLGDDAAADGAGLKASPNGTCGLLGFGGAGKSTTIGMLVTAIGPDSGTEPLFGRLIPALRSPGRSPAQSRARAREPFTAFGERPAPPVPQSVTPAA